MKKHFLTALCALVASPALAHLPPEQHGSFMAGASHPLFGLDHIIAMIAVGVWAMQIGGKAVWAVPAGFVGAMALGFMGGIAALPLPFVEPMILASAILIGLLASFAVKPGLAGGIAVAAVFGLFHGHAHGAELGAAQALGFGVGFVIATALLHAAGILAARLTARALPYGPRLLGALATLMGLSLLIG